VIDFDTSDLMRAVAATIEQVTPDEQMLRAVGFAGAEVFRDGAKHNARSHAKTYTIFNSIITKRLEEESDSGQRQVYLITVRKGNYGGQDAYYWHFVEGGHRFVPRNTRISARTGRKIGWAAHRRAAELEYGSRSVPAHPFMRPAYDSGKVAAVDAMSKKLQEQMRRNRAP
jgi:HK97 gp10 family phage protein